MIVPTPPMKVGVLLSGGLDSSILLARLVEEGNQVQPFYVRSQLIWEQNELRAAHEFVDALNSTLVNQLVTLELPLLDLYEKHWSTTGIGIPDASSPDEAVFLPGRNALLIIKAALWCQMRQVPSLAIGVLDGNPFLDATEEFFGNLQNALNLASSHTLQLIRPFAKWNKRQVMEFGRSYPLELTFSCLQPVDRMHCGTCNKCAERHQAFDVIGANDPTHYAQMALV